MNWTFATNEKNLERPVEPITEPAGSGCSQGRLTGMG